MYRVSHCKVYKVILLCWGYRFWFLLKFWILRIHEIGPLIPKSSVFICLMLRALYRIVYKNSMIVFAKKSLNVPNVKLLSFFFNIFGFLMLFWWECQLVLYILSDFFGIKNLSGLDDLNSLNNLSGFYVLCSLISSKNLYFKVEMYIFDDFLCLLLEKDP